MYGFIQEAVATLMVERKSIFYFDEMKATYQARRDAVINIFDQAGIKVVPSKEHNLPMDGDASGLDETFVANCLLKKCMWQWRRVMFW